jgi:hypothetical protein
MKLSAVALDYDGTIARGDVLDPSGRAAIAVARSNGAIVVLVTGRILDELRRVAGDLHFVCEQLILHGYCVCVIDPEGDYIRSVLPALDAMRGRPAFRIASCWTHLLRARSGSPSSPGESHDAL